MKLLLDNTGLHRVHVVLSTSTNQSITLSDALALLHFAEHIMFSEGMIVSTFELPQVQETTGQAITRLVSEGYVALSDSKLLLMPEEFSVSDYRKACNNAAPNIQDDLQLLDAATVARASRLANFSTKPLGVTSPAMEKWITRSWTMNERRSLINMALEEKAIGAFDFIIASHDPIYNLVQTLGREAREKKKLFSHAMLLDVIFRVAINEQLSRLRGCTYAPAPQRANVTHEADHLFRHALERMIQDSAKDQQCTIPSGLIDRIISVERLPLPIFALHFLEAKQVDSPAKVLDAARELRDSPEILAWRKWLVKWETLYNSADLEAQEKSKKEIWDLERSLKVPSQDDSLYSIFRPEFSTDTNGSLKVSFDLSGFAAPINMLLTRFSRRRIFLAALKRDIIADRELGARMCRILGRAIHDIR